MTDLLRDGDFQHHSVWCRREALFVHLPVFGQDEDAPRAHLGQGFGKRSGHVGQTPGFGEGDRFRGSEQDFHQDLLRGEFAQEFRRLFGGVGLMKKPEPHSNPANLVSLGMISKCQW